MYPSQPNNTHKAITAVAVILAVVLVTVGVQAFDNKKSGSMGASGPMGPANMPSTMSSNSMLNRSSTANYKDGSYTATANYFVPHGYESITVTLSVKNGIVSDSSIHNSESDPESARFQEDFAAQYKSYVQGKNISGLYLSYIAGASDTTQGFDDALRQIQSQAQA